MVVEGRRSSGLDAVSGVAAREEHEDDRWKGRK